jgi:hypothetical protein
VFDGVNNLLTDEAIAALPDDPSPQMGLFEARDATDTVPPSIEATKPKDPGKTEVPQNPAADSQAGIVEHVGQDAAEPTIAARESLAPTPSFLAADRQRPSHKAAWAVFALVAAGALAAQTVLVFRTEVAVLWPAARPHLEAACGLLGCDFRLPRRADLMSIESSDLQSDAQRQGVIVLNALLRNRAPFAQEYPDLELTLTDQGDQPLVRRVLRPADYLQEKRAAIAPGLGGGAEEPVRVHIETAGVLATGYQLFLFYPCPPPSPSAFWQLGYPARCQGPRNK